MKWLLIDDIRNLGCDITCRTGEKGLSALIFNQGQIEVLCIDHDLGEGMNGYQVIEKAIEMNLLPNRVQIVSSNPVGISKIGVALKAEGFTTIDNRNYVRK